MSRIFNATCEAGVVMVDGHVIDPVEILTQGTQLSSGILILDGLIGKYVATNTTDIESALDEIASALGTIASTLTAIGAGMPLSTPPGSLGANVSAINAVKDALNELKGALK